ncbi:5-(carboxyamino)imidazole ribonucleotide synthase [Acuticoccus sp. MNP-M23]|uniref:5-(carboxyamino)imidazole ribonucleotide synthase n=1 Tax=Acuticoccus sp. MNP-M23 TaxID=3072793 RepID=UPI002814DD4D|nr:5-(carboxyamino)imidazole ribonucleotide synthase [Acuticoccus sp. MNP-M23]WMS44844.1 5-(carboxyamino)imidazole ribonucleotide synthase [Acuticoccus sp. MNP-M23]
MTLQTGATIGIVGGGQLGRMMAMAALRLGFRVHVFAPPSGDNVAFAAAHETTLAHYDNAPAMAAFAADVDVLTFEFENVPVAALEGVGTPIRPAATALGAGQDRLTEKVFLQRCGLPVAPHADITDAASLDAARQSIPDGILKARRLGYDGKGQTRITPDVASADALAAIGNVPAILEKRIGFTAETSVVLVRGADGTSRSYDPALNTHENGILRQTSFPAPVEGDVAAEARRLTQGVADTLDYVGVLAVEFFVTDDPDAPLIANEMAPRVHNTGHWTMDGALTGQFENHIRAIAGWPLGDTSRIADVTMLNILGSEIDDLPRHVENPAARCHIYGKRSASPGRKMGHVNFIERTVDFAGNRW